jgi:catechol 2,3-dioxygenase-like lactoylglutathione lyase family enzyme
MRFYKGLFGMQDAGFEDGDLVFLTTPGRNDLLTLAPTGGTYGFPGGCANEAERELKENHPGVQGGVSHFGYMLPNVQEYERVISSVGEFGGRLLTRCTHGGNFDHAYISDPDGYVVELHYGY